VATALSKQSSFNRLFWLRINYERLVNLVQKEIRARYKFTFLGWLWIILTPIIQALVISFFLIKVIGLKTPDANDSLTLPIIILSGLTVWNFISRTMTQSMNAFILNRNLVKNNYLPLFLLPLSNTIVKFIDYLLDTTVLIIIIFILGLGVKINLLALIFLSFTIFLFVYALSLISSLINVFIRDFGHLISFFLSIWFWSSPIFYPASLIAPELWFVNLNPVVHILASYRQIVLTNQLDLEKLIKVFGLAIIFLVIANIFFMSNRKKVYDVE